MLIDSHCHLDMLVQEKGGIEAAIQNAKANQVDHIYVSQSTKRAAKMFYHSSKQIIIYLPV